MDSSSSSSSSSLSSSLLLVLLLLLLLCNIGLMIHIFFVYGFDDFFFFCIIGITIHICLMSLGSKFLYVGLMSLDLNLG